MRGMLQAGAEGKERSWGELATYNGMRQVGHLYLAEAAAQTLQLGEAMVIGVCGWEVWRRLMPLRKAAAPLWAILGRKTVTSCYSRLQSVLPSR